MNAARVPNSQDLLIATVQYLERTGLEAIAAGFAFHEIARDAGLTPWGAGSPVPEWVGRLVDRGHLEHGEPQPGLRLPPKNTAWNDRDMQTAWNYVVTDKGYRRAHEIVIERRYEATDAALGRALPELHASWLTESEAAQVRRCLKQLRNALDDQEPVTVVGAAKELVEAVAVAVLRSEGAPPAAREKFPQLVAKAARAVDPDAEALAKRLGTIAHALAEVRSTTGAQHGGLGERSVTIAEARLAASASAAVCSFLLGQEPDASLAAGA